MYNLQEILAPKKAQTVIRFKDLLQALEYTITFFQEMLHSSNTKFSKENNFQTDFQ